MSFDQVVSAFPIEQINTRLPNVTYTPWHLVEHMRIAQWDILEFIRNPDHVSPEWPTGYWPDGGQNADATQWQETIGAFRANQQALEAIVKDRQVDLLEDLSQAEGYNILREILLVSDHNAYHIGELAVLRQVMGIW